MLGVNEIKSHEHISTEDVLALCEGMLSDMETDEYKLMRREDPDRYFRKLKKTYKRLNDRLPGIFNVLVQYGRQTPDGFGTVERIRGMLEKRDAMDAGTLTREDADKDVDYEYAHAYVRPAIGKERFDSIVKPPEDR